MISAKWVKLLLALALVGQGISATHAGTFTLTPVVRDAWTADLSGTLPSIPDPTKNYGSPIIYEIAIRMDVVALGPGERSFANTGFNINFGGDAEDALDTGWNPDARNGDINGAQPGGHLVPLWFTNTDAGLSHTDLQGVLVSIPGGLTGANDNRRNIGQQPGSITPPPTGATAYPEGILGWVYVLWDGVGGAKGTAGEDYIELTDILFQSADAAGVFGNTVSGSNARLTFGVPEPSSLILTACSFFAVIARRGKAYLPLFSP